MSEKEVGAGSTAEISTTDQNPTPWADPTVVGKPLPRVDGYERVSGSAVYTLDLLLPDMLYAAVLRCPYAHALVKSVNTEAAQLMPGVRAVLTGADSEAQIILPYPWWVRGGPSMLLFDPHCRYEGEEIAAVAAETPYQVWDALSAIKVEYQELPFVVQAEEAVKADSPALHAGGNLVRPVDVYHRGDLAKGFAEADAVLEETYRTSCEIHTPLEAHVAVARWEGERLTVWVPSQAIFEERKSLAAVLGLPLSAVRVISHYIGGSFGCKAELSKHTLIAVLLARKTGQPVKLALKREESFLCVGNRPPNTMTLKAGAKQDGTLTALELTNLGAVGAYADWADVADPIKTLYACPNVSAQETAVYINAGKARAFRAPGEARGAWALEQMIDALAEKIGVDPVDLRLRNLATLDQAQQEPYTSIGLKQCLIEGAKAFGWKEARALASQTGPIRKGVGMAGCVWSITGGPPTTVIVTLFQDGSVNLNMAAADQGTGTKTIMAMVVSEELGVPLDKIHIEHADTAATQYGKSGGGSHSVAVYAPAVRTAAVEVKRQVLDIASEELKQPAKELILRAGSVIPTKDPVHAKRLSELKGLAEQQQIVGLGHPGPTPAGKAIASFGAQFAEVEVNIRTGEIRVVRLMAVHDSGRVMNPLTYESQIFGGMVMGIGFALTEQRVLDTKQTGKMVNANWHDYKIATAKDVPADLKCITIDPHDATCNSVGAKGAGEIGTVPTAPAIANAIFHATGIRVTQSPISPMQMLRLIAARNSGR